MATKGNPHIAINICLVSYLFVMEPQSDFIDQLDDVLKAFSENNLLFYKSFADIRYLSKNISLSDIHLILDKLIKDGYVDVKPGHTAFEDFNSKIYNINANGKIFITNGGYQISEKTKEVIAHCILCVAGSGCRSMTYKPVQDAAWSL